MAASTPMRIAMVTPRYAPSVGGLERHVEELAHRLVGEGVQVEVITTDHTGDLPRTENCRGVWVRRFPSLLRDRLHGLSPQLGWFLFRHARRFDVVHAFSYHTPVILQAACAGKWRGAPLVVTPVYHGTSHAGHHTLHHIYRPLGGWVLRHARIVTCGSRAECDLLHRHFGAELRTRVIPPGVAVQRIPREPLPQIPVDRVVALSVGRLVGYKQVDRLIRAAQHLPPKYQIVVAGDGPARQSLMDLTVEMNLQDQARLLGRVPQHELDGWYGQANVLVALSLYESFGLTLLEAAASGVPVVASDIPAHREVAGYVPPGQVTLVSPNVSPESLAEVVQAAASKGRFDQSHDEILPTWDSAAKSIVACYKDSLVSNATITSVRM